MLLAEKPDEILAFSVTSCPRYGLVSAYSPDRLLAVAVPSEPRATGLAVALALLLAFVTMGLRRKTPAQPSAARSRWPDAAFRVPPACSPFCPFGSVHPFIRDAFRGGVVAEC